MASESSFCGFPARYFWEFHQSPGQERLTTVEDNPPRSPPPPDYSFLEEGEDGSPQEDFFHAVPSGPPSTREDI